MGLNKLSSLISSFKVARTSHDRVKQKLSCYGLPRLPKTNTSNLDRYIPEMPIVNKLINQQNETRSHLFPRNPFDELIELTESGKLWSFPIDNEAGMDHEQSVPFEDHVFFDDLLEKFPKNEYIDEYMKYIVMGLGNNPWMTVQRKREIIEWYLKYFEEKKGQYEASGFVYSDT